MMNNLENDCIIVNISHNTEKVADMIREMLTEHVMFEINDENTRNKATEEIKKFLNNNLQFNICAMCNEWNNTPEIVDKSQLVVDVNMEFSEK